MGNLSDIRRHSVDPLCMQTPSSLLPSTCHGSSGGDAITCGGSGGNDCTGQRTIDHPLPSKVRKDGERDKVKVADDGLISSLKDLYDHKHKDNDHGYVYEVESVIKGPAIILNRGCASSDQLGGTGVGRDYVIVQNQGTKSTEEDYVMVDRRLTRSITLGEWLSEWWNGLIGN